MRLGSYLRRHSGFVRDVATLMSGKTIAAVIALFTTPIVGRLFEPGDFGVAAIFASIIGITSNISSLNYAQAVVIPKTEDEALELLAFSFRVVVLFCLGMLAVIASFEFLQADVKALNLLGHWVWILPLGTLLTSTYHLQEQLLTRRRGFALISASLVAGNSIAASSRIAAGLAAGTSVYGLILGQMAGALTRIVTQWKSCGDGIRVVIRKMGLSGMRRIGRRYSDFPMLSAPAGLILSLGQDLPILLFGTIFSPAVAGYYAMASRLSRVPVTIGANAMRRVFLQRAVTIHNSGRTLGKAFLLTFGGLAALGILPFTLLWLFGEPLLTWLLGAPWAVAGRYMEIIAPWMFMLWAMSPCNAVFIVLRKQRFWLWLQSILTILRLGAFGLAFSLEAGPEWTLNAFVLVSVVGTSLTVLTTIWLSMQHVEPPANNGAAA